MSNPFVLGVPLEGAKLYIGEMGIGNLALQEVQDRKLGIDYD